MSDSGIIDHETLANLLETLGGDEAFLAELIDTYFDDTRELLRTMQQAVADGNAEALRRGAHSLKSNSANFGALALAELCRELEELGKTGAVADAADLVARVTVEYEKVKPPLQAARPAG